MAATDDPADLRSGSERLLPWHWGALSLLFLASRLFDLSAFPLFIDEGFYLLLAEEVLRGLPAGFGEGKPLIGPFIATGLAVGLEPAVAARLPHAAAGLVTLWAIGAFGERFLSRGAAVASMLLWIFLPYPLFFERLTTPDAMLAAAGMVSLYLGAHHATRPGPRLGWLTGGATAVTALVKMPVGFFFAAAPAVAWLLTIETRIRRHRDLVRALLPPALLLAAVGAIAGTRLHLGLQPIGFGLFELTQKGSLDTGWTGWWRSLGHNLTALRPMLFAYLSPPLTLWLGVSLILALVRGGWAHRYLAILGGLYFTIFVAAADVLFPRYLLPALPPLVLLMGWAADLVLTRAAKGAPGGARRGRRVLDGAAILLLLWLTLPFAYTLFKEPRALPLPPTDRNQYVEGWSSGFGLDAAARFVSNALAEDPAAVAIVLHAADAPRLRAYGPDHTLATRLEQVQIAEGRTLTPTQQLERLRDLAGDASCAYVVAHHPRVWQETFAPHFPDTIEIAAFPRPGGVEVVVLELVAADHGR